MLLQTDTTCLSVLLFFQGKGRITGGGLQGDWLPLEGPRDSQISGSRLQHHNQTLNSIPLPRWIITRKREATRTQQQPGSLGNVSQKEHRDLPSTLQSQGLRAMGCPSLELTAQQNLLSAASSLTFPHLSAAEMEQTPGPGAGSSPSMAELLQSQK